MKKLPTSLTLFFLLFAGVAFGFSPDGNNIIPQMNDNNSPPPYIATVSSIFSADYSAYKGFDHAQTNGGNYDWRSQNNQALPQWIQIYLGSQWIVTSYKITNYHAASGNSPTDWIFQGSPDGTNWSTLDSRSGITWSSADQTQSFSFTNISPYFYYRLYVTAMNSGSTLVIAELELFGSLYSGPPYSYIF